MATKTKQPEAPKVEAEQETKIEAPEQPEAPKVEAEKSQEPKKELSKTERMKEALAKQPKVRIMIPREPKEPEGSFDTVVVNGYCYQIKKGVYVEVPEQIAQIIMDSRNETEEAFERAKKGFGGDRPEFDNSK